MITNMARERHFEATTGADSCLIIIGNGFDLIMVLQLNI